MSSEKTSELQAYSLLAIFSVLQTILYISFNAVSRAEESVFLISIPLFAHVAHAFLARQKHLLQSALKFFYATSILIVYQVLCPRLAPVPLCLLTALTNYLTYSFELQCATLVARSPLSPNAIAWFLYIISTAIHLSTYPTAMIILASAGAIRYAASKWQATFEAIRIFSKLPRKPSTGLTLAGVGYAGTYLPNAAFAAWFIDTKHDSLAKDTACEKVERELVAEDVTLEKAQAALSDANAMLLMTVEYLETLVTASEDIFPVSRDDDALAIDLALYATRQKNVFRALQDRFDIDAEQLAESKLEHSRISFELRREIRVNERLEAEREELKICFDRESDRVSALQAESLESMDEIQKLQSTIQTLQRRNGELNYTVTQLESYRSMAAPKLGCYEHEIERLDAELDDLTKGMEKLGADNVRVVRENEGVRTRIARTEMESRNKMIEVAQLQTQVEDLMDTNSRLRSTSEAQSAALIERAQQANELQLQLADVETVRCENQVLVERVAHRDEKIRQLQGAVHRLRSSKNSWKALSQSLERYIDTVALEASDLRQRVVCLEEANAEKDRESRELRRELKEKNAQTAMFIVQVSELTAECEIVQRQKHQVEMRLREARRAITPNATTMEKEKRAEQLANNNRDLAIGNAQLLAKVSSKDAELLGVIKQAEELKQHLLDLGNVAIDQTAHQERVTSTEIERAKLGSKTQIGAKRTRASHGRLVDITSTLAPGLRDEVESSQETAARTEMVIPEMRDEAVRPNSAIGQSQTSSNTLLEPPVRMDEDDDLHRHVAHGVEQENSSFTRLYKAMETHCEDRLMDTSLHLSNNQSELFEEDVLPTVFTSKRLRQSTDSNKPDATEPESFRAMDSSLEMFDRSLPSGALDVREEQFSFDSAFSNAEPVDEECDESGATRSINWSQPRPKARDLRAQMYLAGSAEVAAHGAGTIDENIGGVAPRSTFDRVGRSARQIHGLPAGVPLRKLDTNVPRRNRYLLKDARNESQNGPADGSSHHLAPSIPPSLTAEPESAFRSQSMFDEGKRDAPI
ncbi:hypothetical protein FRB96_007538 [Tulasnella sp. 330]|nr:hypothetical protein FRB96_007538 [Tulasnella sp. 330]